MQRLVTCFLASALVVSGCASFGSKSANPQPAGGQPYIFVIDNGGPPKIIDRGGPGPGRVTVISQDGAVLHRFDTESRNPAVARDAAGRLLLADGKSLSAWDASGWKRVWAYEIRPGDGLAVAPDGKKAWQVVDITVQGGSNIGRLALQAYDLATGKAAGQPVEVFPCLTLGLFTGPGDQVAQFCAGGPVGLVSGGKLEKQVALGAGMYVWEESLGGYAGHGPGGPHTGFAGVFRWPGKANHLLAVRARGQVYDVDLSQKKATEVTTLDLAGQVVPWRQAALSPDGKELYLGLGPDRDTAGTDPRTYFSSTAVWVFDTATWRRVRAFTTPKAVTALAVSPDGKHLLALDSENRSLLFLAATDGKLVRSVNDLGQDPWVVRVE